MFHRYFLKIPLIDNIVNQGNRFVYASIISPQSEKLPQLAQHQLTSVTALVLEIEHISIKRVIIILNMAGQL